MFATISSPEKLQPQELDHLLANGWYRMGQNVFTTYFLCFKNCFYSAVWLRVKLGNNADDPKYRQLKKQNRFFTTEIKKAAITPQHEELYKKYRQAVTFEPTDSLKTLLHGYATENRFNTSEINVYDGETLIAAGYFDLGKISAAGIVSFYHPAYKKYSLGKYLIYAKINFCEQQHIQYFYPGYIVPGYPAFDYKASIRKEMLQYYSLTSQQWLPYQSFTGEDDPLKIMCKELEVLKQMLTGQNISSQVLYYRFFDANLDPYYSMDHLFDFPAFLYCQPLNENENFRLIIYDICTKNYCIIKCSSVVKTDWYQSVEEIFGSHLLKVDYIFFSTKTPEALLTAIRSIV